MVRGPRPQGLRPNHHWVRSDDLGHERVGGEGQPAALACVWSLDGHRV
jgi:hypothetical protein